MILDQHYCPAFDNVSGLTQHQSDVLCRAATGEAQVRRRLYTDDDAKIFKYRRPVILNGIEAPATQPDLLDRSIMLELSQVSGQHRREEAEILAGFAEARPEILGGMFDALASARRLWSSIKLDAMPRMADFAKWGCAIALGLGREGDEFSRAYTTNIKDHREEAAGNDPVVQAVLKLMENREVWEGSATDLGQALEATGGSLGLSRHTPGWPQGPQALSGRLARLEPVLKSQGIVFSKKHSGDRKIRLVQVVNEDGVDGMDGE
jgi:hypothetical protein